MPDRPRSAALYAVTAEFGSAEALLDAARKARAEGFQDLEAFSPFPVEGLAEALGFRERAVAPAMLAGGALGAVAGLALQIGANLDFPLNIGGRPLLPLQAFALIVFELMILGAVCAGVLATLIGSRLPRLHHPMFEIEAFCRASDDRFFLAIVPGPRRSDAARARRFLRDVKPHRIADAPYAEAAP